MKARASTPVSRNSISNYGIAAAAALGFIAAAPVVAQTWPAKAVRIIVPFPPGGASDALSRMVADRLPPLLGQPVIVENRAGAGGNVAAEHVYRSEPDGNTLLSSPPHLLTINHLLYKLNFDPTRLVPVGIIAAYPNVLLATQKLPVSNLGDWSRCAFASRRLNIASQGNGTSTHLTAELFKSWPGSTGARAVQGHRRPPLPTCSAARSTSCSDNLIAASRTSKPAAEAGSSSDQRHELSRTCASRRCARLPIRNLDGAVAPRDVGTRLAFLAVHSRFAGSGDCAAPPNSR